MANGLPLPRLARASVSTLFAFAVTLNVCELPIRDRAYVSEHSTAHRDPTATRDVPGRLDAPASVCEGTEMTPAIPPDRPSPVERRPTPLPPAHAPLSPAS
jgi:hypothetical protein